MKTIHCTALLLTVFAVGCAASTSDVAPDLVEGTAPASSIPGNSPSKGKLADLDLVGMPDMVVRDDMLGGQWLVRDESFDPRTCSVEEGGIEPGEHRVLRFTVGVANVGDADQYIGDPNERFSDGIGDGTFEYATCHRHFHFRHYVEYSLVGEDGRVWRASKRGFCMLDTDPNPAWLGAPPRKKLFDNCGAPGYPGNQGISHGWTDTYRWDLPGQYVVLDGGDGQAPVPPGRYTLRIEANPPFVAAEGEPCPHKDPQGYCHTLPESRYDNNIATVTLVIPDRVGRSGVGPAAGQRENPHGH
jgi:hypothetical protein